MTLHSQSHFLSSERKKEDDKRVGRGGREEGRGAILVSEG